MFVVQMSDYDRGRRGVLVILIPVRVNLEEERDLEKVMPYDGVTWQVEQSSLQTKVNVFFSLEQLYKFLFKNKKKLYKFELTFLLLSSSNFPYMRKVLWDLSVKSFTYGSDGHRLTVYSHVLKWLS